MYYTYENMTGSIDGCMQNIKTTLTKCGVTSGDPYRSLRLPPRAHHQTDSDKQLSFHPLFSFQPSGEYFDCCQPLLFLTQLNHHLTINPIVIISTTCITLFLYFQ